jgi:hypothetical protein
VSRDDRWKTILHIRSLQRVGAPVRGGATP